MIIAGFVLLLHLSGGLVTFIPAVDRWRYRPAFQAGVAFLAALLWLPVSGRLPLAARTMAGAPSLLPEVVWRIDEMVWFLSGFLLLVMAAAMLVALLRNAPASGAILLLAGAGLILLWAGSPVAYVLAGTFFVLVCIVVALRYQDAALKMGGALRRRLRLPERWPRPLRTARAMLRAGQDALAGAAALLEGERGLLWLLALAVVLWLAQR